MPVAIKGTGGGSVTLTAGAAAADTTLTLPNTSGTVLAPASGVLSVASGGTGLSAPGTSGNLLTSNGTAWVSSAPASTASLTLLATLTTTSGTTQSATGLATTYTNLVIAFSGVSNSTGSDQILIAASSNNGSAYGATSGTFAGTQPYSGAVSVFSANSNSTVHFIGFTNSLSVNNVLATTTAAPINALRFSWASGYTFNAGTIYIYGWK